MPELTYPFTALVGQEELRLALQLAVIAPHAGGVLIVGEKGTAKSTAVRGLAALLPMQTVVAGCPFRCAAQHHMPPQATQEALSPPLAPSGHTLSPVQQSLTAAPETRTPPPQTVPACLQAEQHFVCPYCTHHPEAQPTLVSAPLVTLPLNATEDRVIGCLDIEQAIRTGKRVLQAGLLAQAHRGILYVDEINLLDDHLVDSLLDAASSGYNRIERESLQTGHPARFTLLGTMNPEEGELRPQLKDRFALCVVVCGDTDLEHRVELMRRKEAFDADPEAFCARYAASEAAQALRLATAISMFPKVSVAQAMRRDMARLCQEAYVAGHRAELALENMARAHAALHNRLTVSLKDLAAVVGMVLYHRKREAIPPEQASPQQQDHAPHNPAHNTTPEATAGETTRDKLDSDKRPEKDSSPDQNASAEPHTDKQEATSAGDQGQAENQNTPATGDQAMPSPTEPRATETSTAAPSNADHTSLPADPTEALQAIGATFRVQPFASPKDTTVRRGSGRRSSTRTAQRQGRYIRSVPVRSAQRVPDIALDATLRAAAPFQRQRRESSPLAICLQPSDLREKIRERRIGNALLFVVDASGSMGARGRMSAAKGAIMSLLLDAYQKRDQVALIAFRRHEAALLLPFTGSIERAGRLLETLPTGGKTPLSSGLATSYTLLERHLARDPHCRPIVFLITDGRANVPLHAAQATPSPAVASITTITTSPPLLTGTQTATGQAALSSPAAPTRTAAASPPIDEALALATRMGRDARIRYVVVDTEAQELVHFGLAKQIATALGAHYYNTDNLQATSLLALVKEIV